MSTITTKQLRQNMAQVVRDLQKGKAVNLTYRHKVVGVLQPITMNRPALRRGSPAAILQALEALKNLDVPEHIRNDPRSLKEQIAELRNKKYGR